jgi:hypothetical protein
VSTVQWIAGVVGAAIMAATALPVVRRFFTPAMPTYKAAINHLAEVRTRLRETGHLSDDQRKAIDVLTLALVDGSDS